MSLSGSASGTIPAGSPSGNPAAAAGQNSARPTPAALAGGASPLAGRSATSGTVPAPAPVERAPSGTVPPAGRSVPTPLEALRAQPANPSAPPAGGRSAAQPANRPPETKFDRYMQAAQLDMQQGQYLPAAESFALASVCSPKDARPQIGRCHALFAAGDFPGSAVCLAKAIELDPRLILKKPEQKSEFVEAAGGPDRFVQRITELEQRVRAGSVPGLQVLLAYFYHAMDRTEQARTAIRIAKRALPAPAAVTLLEAAIEGKPLN